MKNNFSLKKLFVVILPSLLLLFGFIFNEDLSTGGSKLDFYQTFPVVDNFANNIFSNIDSYTRHFPLHYLILSFPYSFFENIYITRIFYLVFASITPIFIYLNLSKLYPENSDNNLAISFAILFIPYFRASAIWPNAHLTALIFLLISNFFFLVYLNNNKKIFIFLNIFFLTCATYSIQSYSIFFLFYLFEYYKKVKINNFVYILFICSIFSLPGFYLVLNTPLGAKLDFTENFSYTIITNFSIIFFFIMFFLLNKKNFLIINNFLKNIKKTEIFFLIFTFVFLLINYKNFNPGIGGGFFYKISFFIFKNEIIFFITAFLAIFLVYLIFKKDKKLFLLIVLTNFTSTAYYTSQKYFEPLLIILILILCKNFLTKNMITNKDGVFKFYSYIIIYFFLALLNNYLNVSKNLIY